MDLGVAIDTTAIERPYIQRFPGGGRMTGQHMNMALLAHQMNAIRQKLGIARTMRRVTVQAILADRRMVPEKRTPFFGMAGVTRIIDGMTHEHLFPLPAMRIVAGRAADLHVAKLGAKQVGGALKKVRPPVVVAGEASLLVGSARQHFGLRLGVVGAMTGQAAHVTAIVLAATPAKMGAIPGVALQTRFVDLRFRQIRRIDDVLGFPGLIVLCAVAVATLARRGARILQEFGAFAVIVQGEGLHNFFVALHALLANHGLLKGLTALSRGLRLGDVERDGIGFALRFLLKGLPALSSGLRLGRGDILPHKGKEKADNEH